MIKLPPKMGSCSVPEALTKQLPLGSTAGKKTVKPRFGFTCDQSVTVVGVPTEVVVGLVSVPVAVTVVAGVLLAVVRVPVTGACSSRKRMNGLLHQCNLAKGSCAGVATIVADELPVPPPKLLPEQDTSNKLAKQMFRAKESHTGRQRTTKTEHCGTSIHNCLSKCSQMCHSSTTITTAIKS